MPPSNEERLASIEAHLSHLAEGMVDLNKTLSTILTPEVADTKRQVTTLALDNERIRGEIRLLRIAVGIALLGGVSGGGSVLLRVMGLGG